VFLIVVGIALAVLLIRLATTAGRLSGLLSGLEQTVVPLLTKTGGTVDRVNVQLDKVDLVTDSAVSAADSLDTAVRAVSFVVTRPVQKVSALAKGLSQGAAALVDTMNVRAAMQAGKDASRRREQELAEELGRRDRLQPRQPAPTPTPAPEPAAPTAAGVTMAPSETVPGARVAPPATTAERTADAADDGLVP
jgi:uncharacterized protein YoxC